MSCKIQNAINAYCIGACSECIYDNLCEIYDMYGVDDAIFTEAFYLGYFEIIIRPRSEDKKAVIKLYADVMDKESWLSDDEYEKHVILAEGIQMAYRTMSHIDIEFQNGKVVEKHTGIQLYPFKD